MTLTPDDPRHGSVTGYDRHKCRCDACRAGHAGRARARRAKTAALRPTPYWKEPGYTWHGTRGGYTNHKCRCDACRAAWNEYCLGARKRRSSGHIPEHVHGTCNGHDNYGCRCLRCLNARREREGRLYRGPRKDMGRVSKATGWRILKVWTAQSRSDKGLRKVLLRQLAVEIAALPLFDGGSPC